MNSHMQVKSIFIKDFLISGMNSIHIVYNGPQQVCEKFQIFIFGYFHKYFFTDVQVCLWVRNTEKCDRTEENIDPKKSDRRSAACHSTKTTM